MKRRVKDVSNERNKCYVGISVCKRWNSFENFLADMGECIVGYSLDRISNSKGYMKSNCRWVPLAEQQGNTTRNRKVKFGGVTAHISKHARDIGLKPDVVFDRLNKLNWDVQRALSTPLKGEEK